MEKNKRLVIIIVILVICVIGLGGYLTYDKWLNKKDSNVPIDESKLETAKNALKVESLSDVLRPYFTGEKDDKRYINDNEYIINNKEYNIRCNVIDDEPNTCFTECEGDFGNIKYSMSVTCSGCDEDIVFYHYSDYIIVQKTSCAYDDYSFDILNKNKEKLISLDGSFIDIVDGKIYYVNTVFEDDKDVTKLYYVFQKDNNMELKYIKNIDSEKFDIYY